MYIMQYQIKIRQTLNSSWDEWFAPLEIHPQPNGTTLLTGDLPDQTALHSVLNKIRNLNLELVSVNYTEAQEDTKNIDETDKKNNAWKPWLMLAIRSLLFLAFQALIALGFFIGNTFTAWDTSAAWWPFAIIFTDLVCLGLLIRFYREEGNSFWDVFRIEQQFVKQDLLFMLGFLVIGGLLGYLPNILSARWLFGDPQVALDLLVRPLPAWAAIASIVLFPILQGLVEIPTYMLYVMPRLEAQGTRPWLAVALASFFLSFQHVFAPFLPDGRFITYRMVMFLPFAILIAIVMRARPRLMPYMAVVHVLMDMSVAVMFLFVMK
jgi:hypothetical protein